MNIAGERVLVFGDSLSSRHSRCDDPRSADQYDVVEGTNRTASAPGDLLASYLLAQRASAARVDARVCRSAWNFWRDEDASKLLAADLAWKPSLVVIMLGTNDIGLNMTKDGGAYARLVKTFHDAGAKVVAIGPPTFPGALSRLNDGIPAVLQMIIKNVGKDNVVDARPLSADLLSATYRTVAQDSGVHFTKAGAPVLADRLARALVGLPGAGQTKAAALRPLGIGFGLTLGLGLLIGGLVWSSRRRRQPSVPERGFRHQELPPPRGLRQGLDDGIGAASDGHTMEAPDRICRRCMAVRKANRKVPLFTCRVCHRKVCEHLCGNKVEHTATCTSCLMQNRLEGPTTAPGAGWVSVSDDKQPRIVSVTKLFAFRPKLEETIVDVREGRTSYSKEEPLTVSRLDSPRGAFFVVDGHHRLVEKLHDGQMAVPVVISKFLPRIERTGGAYQHQLAEKVNVVERLKSGSLRG